GQPTRPSCLHGSGGRTMALGGSGGSGGGPGEAPAAGPGKTAPQPRNSPGPSVTLQRTTWATDGHGTAVRHSPCHAVASTSRWTSARLVTVCSRPQATQPIDSGGCSWPSPWSFCVSHAGGPTTPHAGQRVYGRESM